jgi:hypothetical protein
MTKKVGRPASCSCGTCRKYADENRMVEFFDTLQVVSSTDAVLA